jgi:hypothetical protein
MKKPIGPRMWMNQFLKYKKKKVLELVLSLIKDDW